MPPLPRALCHSLMSDTSEFNDALWLQVVSYAIPNQGVIRRLAAASISGCPGSSQAQDGKRAIFDAQNSKAILIETGLAPSSQAAAALPDGDHIRERAAQLLLLKVRQDVASVYLGYHLLSR